MTVKAEDIPRISPRQAKGRVASGEALLVCAYEDKQKWRSNNLKGSIPLDRLQGRLGKLEENTEIILYCA